MTAADMIPNVAIALAMIVVLILLMGFLSKKTNILRKFATQDIEILGRTPLGKQSNLILVKLNDQKLLLGVTPHHISTLYEYKQEFKQYYVEQAAESSQKSEIL